MLISWGTKVNQIVCPLLAWAAVLTIASQASADAGIPAPSVDLGFVFKNLGKYRDYDFYLKYEVGGLNPKARGAFLTKVEPDTLTRLEGRGRQHSEIFLIALPRGQMLPAPVKANPEWLKNPPADGLQSPPLKGDAPGGGLGNGYDIIYTVRIDGGVLEVDWIESNLNAWWWNFWLFAILIGAACVLIPIGFVVLVVWLIARATRKS
jgi:hypothetical protein